MSFENVVAKEMPGGVVAALAMADRFAIRTVAAVSQFESFGNENWLLEMPHGRRVVLRRYVHSNPARVRFQLRLQEHLRERGFPAAEVLVSATGARSELDGDGVAWAAFAHIEGREYDLPALQA